MTRWTVPAAFDTALVGAFADVGNQLAKALGLSRRTTAMRILSGDASSPSLVLWSEIKSAFGVLMPYRGDNADSVPEFFGANAPVIEALQAAE